MSVGERNSKIDSTLSSAPKTSAAWIQYAKTFVCIHHGKYKSQAGLDKSREPADVLQRDL
ncbi:uncharacterized protein PITG_17946 [Phytophthora infestans T30-4]|uniref:Uncharacterized protein n=1 Tax=Phytophthora infestans (strain T30-4) TaxID=403677 RepID=D0NXB8_PHYIT|nr:uncharacterized protein PITG_17946 [Phytophthora infestans T30-4]EEY67715.1 hypothetical protein PITG_17946 [Phytophthora infestans T30-4]|eukprot:XP_002896268.1 hypothetical protein PITG_17946 [Phytophthora infestans T30-4]